MDTAPALFELPPLDRGPDQKSIMKQKAAQDDAAQQLAHLLRQLRGPDLALYRATRQDNGHQLIDLATPQAVDSRQVIPAWRNRPYLPLIQPYPKFTDADYSQPPAPPIELDVLGEIVLPPPDAYETLLAAARATIPLKHSLHHLRNKWIHSKKEYPREPEPAPEWHRFKRLHLHKQQVAPYRIRTKVRWKWTDLSVHFVQEWKKEPLTDCGHPSCISECETRHLAFTGALRPCTALDCAPPGTAHRAVDWETGEILA